MSLKKVEQAKRDKFFRLWDLLVYGIVVLLIVVFFIAVFFIDSDDSFIEARYDGELAFTYSFDSDELEIALDDNVRIQSEDGDALTLVFCTDGGSYEEGALSGYNIIEIDKSARTVRVTGTDCSNSRDCMSMSIGGGPVSVIIYCAPHNLVIQPSTNFDGGGSDEIPIG